VTPNNALKRDAKGRAFLTEVCEPSERRGRSGKQGGMHFEVIGDIEEVQIIAVGGGIREIMRLHRQFGRARWCKRCTGMRRTAKAGRR